MKLNSNSDSNRGVILELLFNIGAQEASICHDIETYHFLLTDKEEKSYVLRNVFEEDAKSEIQDEINKIDSKILRLLSLIKSKTKIRQKKMSILENLSKDFDHYFHCSIKHFIRVIESDTEILHSLDYNEEFLEIIVQDYKDFSSELSMYLGIDYTDCFRCISDSLKETENE